MRVRDRRRAIGSSGFEKSDAQTDIVPPTPIAVNVGAPLQDVIYPKLCCGEARKWQRLRHGAHLNRSVVSGQSLFNIARDVVRVRGARRRVDEALREGVICEPL